MFVTALGVNAVGSVLQIAALHVGSLAVVQPLIVLNLLFAVVIAEVVVGRRPPDAIMVAGAACAAVGVGSFLAIARPSGVWHGGQRCRAAAGERAGRAGPTTCPA